MSTGIKAIAKRAGIVLLREGVYSNLVRQLHDSLATSVVEVPHVESRTDYLEALMGTDISQAMHILHWLHATRHIAGDVCEFGVAQGATSALLANDMLSVHDGRGLWLYDSFVGLPAPTEEDVLIDDIFGLGAIESYEGSMAVPSTVVKRRLRAVGFPSERLTIVPGFITGETRGNILPFAVSFAYIDFDLYQPIKNALRLLRERASPGAVIIIDDYGYFSAGAQAAVDEFAAECAPNFELIVGPIWAGHFAILRRT